MQKDVTISPKVIANSHDPAATIPQLRFAQQLPLHKGALAGCEVVGQTNLYGKVIDLFRRLVH